jgi:hypothetical protein
MRRMIRAVLMYGVLGLGTTVTIAWFSALIAVGPSQVVYEGFDASLSNRDWAGSIQIGTQRRFGFQRRCYGYSSMPGPKRSAERSEYQRSVGATHVNWGYPQKGRISVSGEFMPAPVSMEEVVRQSVEEILLSLKAKNLTAAGVALTSRWGRFQQWTARRDWDALDNATQGLEDGAGWPFPALWCAYDAPMGWEPAPGALVPVYGLEIDAGRAPSVVATVRALPLHPVWGGLALNTLFWGTVWFAGVSGVGAAKRRWRRRRKRCVGCGYDLCGTASIRCPECGRER